MRRVFTRYLVVKVAIEADASRTDQDPQDHAAELMEEVLGRVHIGGPLLNESITLGGDAQDAIEIPVRITKAEVVNLVEGYDALGGTRNYRCDDSPPATPPSTSPNEESPAP